MTSKYSRNVATDNNQSRESNYISLCIYISMCRRYEKKYCSMNVVKPGAKSDYHRKSSSSANILSRSPHSQRREIVSIDLRGEKTKERYVLNFESYYVNHMKCQHQYWVSIHFFISISSAIAHFLCLYLWREREQQQQQKNCTIVTYSCTKRRKVQCSDEHLFHLYECVCLDLPL